MIQKKSHDKKIQILNKKISMTDLFSFASGSSMVQSGTGEWIKEFGRALLGDMERKYIFMPDRLVFES